jgi:TolB protein
MSIMYPRRRGSNLPAVVAALAVSLFVLSPARAQVGDFEAAADVGKVDPPGSASFDKSAGRYTVKAAGANVWAKLDAFHFVYRKSAGDLTMTADIAFVGGGKNAHRKAGLMIRQSLDADAAYVDVMIHGDGLIALQYRAEKGGVTKDVSAKVRAPATVRLERKGDTFTLSVAAAKGEAFAPAAEIKVALADPVYAGLAVCSHDATTPETAVFTGVSIKDVPSKAAPEKRN